MDEDDLLTIKEIAYQVLKSRINGDYHFQEIDVDISIRETARLYLLLDEELNKEISDG